MRAEWLLLFAILLTAAHGATAASGLTTEFTPAWNGLYTPGRSTEVRVTLIAQNGGDFELTLSTGTARTNYSGSLEADTPTTFWLPIRPHPGEPLMIDLQRPGNTPLHQEISLTSESKPLLARVSGSDRAPSNEPVTTIAISELPHTASGYGPVGSLLVHRAALIALDPSQASALGSYLSDCGGILLTDADESLATVIRKVSGCGGRFVQRQQSGPAIPFPPPQPLPGSTALSSLAAAPGLDPVPAITLFFLAYSGFLVVAGRAAPHPALLPTLPLAASLALILFWPLHSETPQMTSWAEMGNGERDARYSAVLTAGDGSAREIPLSRQMDIPRTLDAAPVELAIDAKHPALQRLTLPRQPFARLQYHYQGTLSAPRVPWLDVSGSVPELVNHEDTTAPAGLLAWDRKIHSVPVLAPGQRWSPSDQSLLFEADDLVRLFKTRAGDGNIALLLPYNLHDAGLFPTDAGATGWLLIRGRRG